MPDIAAASNATKYETQQVYVVNLSNAQKKGTVDYLVVQNNPQKRWLINYITDAESYLDSKNLSNIVLVLEIANKSTGSIIQEVSTFINDTKG